MISTKLSVLSSFVLIESVAGLILNTVIVVVNFRDWRKGMRLQPSDQIHLTMGLVNLLLQCVVMAGFLMSWNPDLFEKYMVNMTFILMYLLLSFCFWLNTCLCVYYLTSIANFNHRFFSWLKSHFSVITPRLILVAAVGSFIFNLAGIGKINMEIIKENATFNSRVTGFLIHVDSLYLLITVYLGCLIPFTLSTLCLGYTVMYIVRHIWRIKHNDSGSTRPSLQAHVRAARTMVLLFVLSLSLNVTQTFYFVSSRNALDITILNVFATLSFPSCQAFIIIQASAKLRQGFQLKGCFRNACIVKCKEIMTLY